MQVIYHLIGNITNYYIINATMIIRNFNFNVNIVYIPTIL